MTGRSESSEELRIGFLGGSFDPIHFGHLLAANEAMIECELDRCFFSPYNVSPREDDATGTDSEERVHMTKLALQDLSWAELSLLEQKREGPSYTVETLRQLRKQFPEAVFYLIIGADNLMEFETWYRPEEILSLAKLFVLNRNDWDGNLPEGVRSMTQQFDTTRIKIQSSEGPEMRISSTMIRKRIQSGTSIRFLTPEPVRSYIRDQTLYELVQ